MLTDRIKQDLNQALKKKESLKVSTLRFLIAGINNYQIAQKRKELKDPDILSVISKQVKNRKQSIAEFKKGKRSDLVEKETQELNILKEYLPEQLSEKELISQATDIISELGAAGRKDMGKVMKAMMEKTKGRADGKTVSKIISEQLAKLETKEKEA